MDNCFLCWLKDLLFIVLGVAGGMAGSIFLIIKVIPNLFAPNIKVAPNIAWKIEKGSRRYRIKIINKTKFDIIDISAELKFQHIKPGSDLIITKSIPLVQPNLYLLKKYKPRGNRTEFAYKFLVSHEAKVSDLFDLFDKYANNNPSVRFRILATHSATNFPKVINAEFSRNDFSEGDYRLGNSFIIE
ncbi:MAG TPA: hypothetical protein PLW31_04095 [Bacteroidales bacterium]|nr:hypothetical protein [Bacteroidales bacterium]HPI84884.1 hypothetical protein [Bacteroidales bacterium]